MTRSAYIRLGGGIDLITPPEQLQPGAAITVVNYECPVSGGYRRCDGYTAVGPVVPGEGALLGVASLDTATFAIRKDVGAATATLYKLNTGTNAWDTVNAVENARHEFVDENFTATAGGRALYGVGGGKPFELKKDATFTSLTNAPSGGTYIIVFKEHLFLGFTEGSLQHSGPGTPNNWDASTGGAGEIGVGQEITGLTLGRGGVLHTLCRDSIQTLYGTSSANWELRVTIPNSGARPYSGQVMQQPYYIAERGIASLEASDQFGDFTPMQPGYTVEPLFVDGDLVTRVVASAVSKQKAQYRVFFDNKTGLYMSPSGITTVSFPDQVSVTYSGELDDGNEMLLFGSDAGQVYRLDNDATSFAGADIEAYLTLAYNDLNSPNVRKRFRRAFWDVRGDANVSIAIQADLDYGGDETVRLRRAFLDILLGEGLWSRDDWGSASWSVPSLGQEVMDLTGTGTSINFSIYAKSSVDSHELLGYDIDFEPRRRRRG